MAPGDAHGCVEKKLRNRVHRSCTAPARPAPPQLRRYRDRAGDRQFGADDWLCYDFGFRLPSKGAQAACDALQGRSPKPTARSRGLL